MPLPRLRPRSALGAAAGFVALHGIGIIAFPAAALAISYFFMFVSPLCAVLAAWSWALRGSSRLRICGALVAVGLTLWSGGMALDAWDDLVKHAGGAFALLPDLVYFFYGVPILFAISVSTADQRSRFFLALYGLQALVVAYLAYIVLFSGAPFTGEASRPISGFRLAQAFLAENIVLAVAGSVRLLACSGAEERWFFRVLAVFLWIYLGISTLYNFAFPNVDLSIAGLNDLLIDVPFLLLAFWFAYAPDFRAAPGPDELARMTPLALFISSGSPIFFTFGMLALGTVVMQRHFVIGSAGVGIALGCYGLQATLLQNRYIRSQHSLREALNRLEDLSMTDGLTGIANRRCFDETLDRELSRAKRSGQMISLLMIDLDYFKKLNDRYGHVYGDECLIAVAHTLRAALPRDADMLARYGGEEFAAILPETDRLGAETVAGKMRAAVRRLAIRNETAIADIVTISVGIATFAPGESATCLDLIRGSDNALYRAKQEGRDRIEFYIAV